MIIKESSILSNGQTIDLEFSGDNPQKIIDLIKFMIDSAEKEIAETGVYTGI